MAESVLNRVLAPRVVLPLVVLIIIGLLLVTPREELGSAGPRLTTFSPQPNGAAGLYEALRRLGRRVERRAEPFGEPLDGTATYAVLAPPIDLSAAEVHALLGAVRSGARLIVALRPGSRLADSLGLRLVRRRFVAIADSIGVHGAITPGPERCRAPFPRPIHGTAHVEWALRARDEALPAGRTVYLSAEGEGARGSPAPVALGFPLGGGRVIAVADPQVLRNDVIGQCQQRMGVLAMRMVESLSAPGDRVIFDEYHHGHGRHPSAGRVVWQALRDTPPGRAAMQLGIAGLVLLVALGVRPIAPRARERMERRSPLEHVGALARAYEQVGATRRATRLLVRGLRRRHTVGAARDPGDDEFLRALAARHSGVAADAELLLDAMHRPRTPAGFLAVGRAIAHIEEIIASDHGRGAAAARR